MYSGELTNGFVTAKQITSTEFASGMERFRVVDLKSTDVDYIDYATASSTSPYGITRDKRTTTQISNGETLVDVLVPVPGDEITCTASAEITALAKCGLAANGKIVALSANSTPTDQYCYCIAIETASADGNQIICRYVGDYIQY